MSHKKTWNRTGYKNKIVCRVLSAVFWLIVWQVVTLAVNNQVLLAGPLEVVASLVALTVKSSFWQAAIGSLLRIGLGFLLGFFAAIFLSWFSFRFQAVEELLRPVIGLMKTVPVAAFAVLLLIWWGSSFLATVICFLVVLPNLYLNILAGLKATDRKLVEMAEVFHMPFRNRLFYIYRPALAPFLESGLKLSLGMCWKSGVAAEVIGTPVRSIGGQLYLSKIYLDTTGVLAWTAVIILLSLCMEQVILGFVKLSFAWNPLPQTNVWADLTKHRKELHGAKMTMEQVYKSYGDTEVLKNATAIYEMGNIYYLQEPSGSGKTTRLRIMCGLEKPDRGTVELLERCSMVFQEDRLCESYSAILNVAMVTGNRRSAAEALGKLLPEEALEKPCEQLSGGMKRRVALVRAMEAASDAVLLDEPFTGMDAETRRSAEAYIKETQRGRILIIVSHVETEEK